MAGMTKKDLLQLGQTGRQFGRLGESKIHAGDAARLQFSQRFYLRAFEPGTLFCSVDRACDPNETFRDDQRTSRSIKVRESNNFYHAMKILNCKIGHAIALLRRHGLDRLDDPAEANFPAV